MSRTGSVQSGFAAQTFSALSQNAAPEARVGRTNLPRREMSDCVYQEIFKACRPFYDTQSEPLECFICLWSLPPLLDDGLKAKATARNDDCNDKPLASSLTVPLRVSGDI
jgi:hypothetical protein